jgi:hypothetical protein
MPAPTLGAGLCAPRRNLMSTMYRYTLPVEQTEWKFDGHTDVVFNW